MTYEITSQVSFIPFPANAYIHDRYTTLHIPDTYIRSLQSEKYIPNPHHPINIESKPLQTHAF